MQVKHMASFRGVTADECERMKVRALERNIFVKFMFDKMKEVIRGFCEKLAHATLQEIPKHIFYPFMPKKRLPPRQSVGLVLCSL